jgi:hypothetical protein
METECDELFEVEKYEWGTCPLCKGPWDFSAEQAVDSATLPLKRFFKPRTKATLSYHACLRVYVCSACQGEFYFVEVDFTGNTKVSAEWQDCFFRRNCGGKNMVTGETTTNLTLSPVWGSGMWVEETPTVEGFLYRVYMGPFVPKRPLRGPKGVCYRAGSPDWRKAAQTAAIILLLLGGAKINLFG